MDVGVEGVQPGVEALHVEEALEPPLQPRDGADMEDEALGEPEGGRRHVGARDELELLLRGHALEQRAQGLYIASRQ